MRGEGWSVLSSQMVPKDEGGWPPGEQAMVAHPAHMGLRWSASADEDLCFQISLACFKTPWMLSLIQSAFFFPACCHVINSCLIQIIFPCFLSVWPLDKDTQVHQLMGSIHIQQQNQPSGWSLRRHWLWLLDHGVFFPAKNISFFILTPEFLRWSPGVSVPGRWDSYKGDSNPVHLLPLRG